MRHTCPPESRNIWSIYLLGYSLGDRGILVRLLIYWAIAESCFGSSSTGRSRNLGSAPHLLGDRGILVRLLIYWATVESKLDILIYRASILTLELKRGAVLGGKETGV